VRLRQLRDDVGKDALRIARDRRRRFKRAYPVLQCAGFSAGLRCGLLWLVKRHA